MVVLEDSWSTFAGKQTSVRIPCSLLFTLVLKVEGVIKHLLQQINFYLDKADSTVGTIFYDFSSVFNIIQLDFLYQNLQNNQASTITWIKVHLTHTLFIRLKGRLFNQVVGSTGAL